MFPASVFITGANRGIGLGLVREFLKEKSVKHVFAGAREPDSAKELNAINDNRLKIIEIDIECDQSIKNAYMQIEEIVGDCGLNLLLNNAAVQTPYFTKGEISRETMMKCLNTNVIGTAIISQVFLPLLRRASAHSSGEHLGVDRAAIVNISSFWGSISANEDGSAEIGALVYKMSKSCVNQLGKTMSIDLTKDKILVVQLDPGWVQTEMGNYGGRNADLTVEKSASALVNTISKLENQHNGGYYDRHLKALPY